MKLILISLSLFFIAESSFAFPNNIRHGYTSCYNCHFNQRGGGALNSYGKYLAGETQGTFNTYESALPWLSPPKDMEAGPTDKDEYVVAFLGRWAKVNTKVGEVETEREISMQSDIESAFNFKSWIGLLTFGQRLDSYNPAKGQRKEDLFIRRYYVGRQTEEYSIRVGQFMPEFGINLPNHNLKTRGGLYWGPNQEQGVIQASYFAKYLDVSASYIQGREDTVFEEKNGFSATASLKYKANKVGFSIIDMQGIEDDSKENAMSLFGMFGYADSGYTLAEFVQKTKTRSNGNETESRLGYLESGWELYKGIIPYVNWQFFENVTIESYSHDTGFGLQFLPLTHFEINFQYFKSYFATGTAETYYTTLNVYF